MARYYTDENGVFKKYEEPSKKKKEKKEEDTWFKSGAFGDGNGNPITDTALTYWSTIGDAYVGAAKGIVGMAEGIADLGMYGVAGVADLVGADGAAEGIRGAAKKNVTNAIYYPAEKLVDKNSVLGNKADMVSQGLGQALGIIATSGAGSAAGLSSGGTTALTTGVNFLSSAGSGMSEAYAGGATDEEAALYGAAKGTIDASSELLFGGLGKMANATGISKGIGGIDDIVADRLTKKITNQLVKNTAKYAFKSAGEGVEEVIAGALTAKAKQIYSEEEFSKLLEDENLLEQFIVGSMVGGIVSTPSLVQSNVSGRDYTSGLTVNEQRVVDAEIENRIADEEKDGRKLTNKEKKAIAEQVEKDLKRGYVSIDTIESTLGGNDYSEYKNRIDSEEKLKEEIEQLRNIPESQITVGQRERLNEARKELEDIQKTDASELKNRLSTEVDKITVNDMYLRESYNEKTRRSTKYEADVSKYDEKHQATIQKAIDSGILNNTNRTHEFVDMIAKISADKGVSFDFADSKKIRESGFALEGATVNGYVSGNDIVLNINSAKALNRVVGHEITHVIEGTDLYSELQAAVKEYAESKGEYQKRYDALASLYENVEGAVIENELTADMIGDYLFTDEDFINRLSTEKPGVFKKIYEEIKYLVKVATAGSKEAKQLEKVKRAFDKAYKQTEQRTREGKVKYSIDYEQLDNFLEQVDINNGQTNYKYNQYSFSYVPEAVAKMIYKATDGRVNVENKKFAFEGGKLSHEFKSHGNEKLEAARGQRHYSKEDTNKIIETMMEPDIVEDISSGDKLDQRNAVAFAKEFEGEMIVVAAIGGKNNPNIVPEQILWFTEEKWNEVIESEKTLREVIYENTNRRGKMSEEEIEKIKKNRVTVAHGESIDSSARYVQDVPRSPLNDSITLSEENTSNVNKMSLSADEDVNDKGYNVYGKDLLYQALDEIGSRATSQETSDDMQSQPETELQDYTPNPEVYETEVTDADMLIDAKIENYKVELQSKIERKEDAHNYYNKEIARKQSVLDKKKNKNTKAAQQLASQIERLKTKRDTSDAEFDKQINAIKERIDKMNSKEYRRTEQRKIKLAEIVKEISELIGDTSTWKDKKTGFGYKLHTLKRNLRDVVGDTKKADEIYRALQGRYNHNEALLNTESNKIKKEYADMHINKYEDQYIQMLGEYKYNPDTTLTAEVMDKFYSKHAKKIDKEKVDRVIEMARDTYDGLFERVNEVLREHGLKEIEYREGYFPHFTKEPQGLLAKLLNWKKEDNSIPTDIAGLTEQFKPNRSWQSFSQHRQSDVTDYSFLTGLDAYVSGSLDWIYHINDIQRFRAFENEVRYRHSDVGTQEEIKKIEQDENLSDEAKQAAIDHIYEEKNNPLNQMVQNIRTHTNLLAGKKNTMDRAMEEDFSRNVYSVMKNGSSRISANMVGGSISSALTNFIPITQSWSQVSPVTSLRAMSDTLKSYFVDDGTVAKSDFLTNRLRATDKLSKSTWDKISDKISFMMSGIDNFTSQTVWRSKYIENIENNMDESQAIQNADEFTEGVIAGRSRGSMPLVFEAKNPLYKIFTTFQLEVANQYDYMFKDMPTDMKEEKISGLAKGYASMFIGAYAYNALFSKLTGRNAAFDPIRIVQELLGDLFDDEEDKPSEVLTKALDTIGGEVPYIGGIVFGGGRIPVSSALPYDGLIDSVTNTASDLENKNYKNLAKEWLNPVYYLAFPAGGGQLKKINEGMAMFSDDNPVAGSYTTSGNLRFAVEDNTANRIQALLFGQWASENAQQYVEEGRLPLKEKQIDEFAELGMSMQDYWTYRDGLSGKKTVADKFDYISNLNVTDEQKNIMINNLLNRNEEIDMSDYDNYGSYEEFDYYSKNPEKYVVSKAIGEFNQYSQYVETLSNIKSDKDENGENISGSRKDKVVDYINSIDADYGAKIILYKMEYPSDDTYNMDIVEYLNEREDISYEEMVTILKYLGFTVDENGTVRWE